MSREALFAEPADDHRAKLEIVLDDQDLRTQHVPEGSPRNAAEVGRRAPVQTTFRSAELGSLGCRQLVRRTVAVLLEARARQEGAAGRNADKLTGLLAQAGLADIEVREPPTPYRAASVEEWWSRTAALAGPLAQRLAALPEHAARALFARARAAIAAYETPAGLEIPGSR